MRSFQLLYLSLIKNYFLWDFYIKNFSAAKTTALLNQAGFSLLSNKKPLYLFVLLAKTKFSFFSSGKSSLILNLLRQHRQNAIGNLEEVCILAIFFGTDEINFYFLAVE
jgi:hypothetical protein